jgi:hypothetical protein
MSVPKVTQRLLEPGIIKVVVIEDSTLEMEDIVLMRKINLELSHGMPFSILLDASKGYFSTSKEGNHLLASDEYVRSRKATAIVVKSLAARLAGNFFKKLNEPSCPTRLFNSEEDAIIWLRAF